MFAVRRFVGKPRALCRFLNTETKPTHFGFEEVTEEEKTKKVYEVFQNVASNYDVMNDAMSLGIHRIWKDIFVERLGPINGIDLLDVAGGTGDIAFRVLKYLKNNPTPSFPGKITVCDINKSMLKVGEERAVKAGYLNVEWIEGNAEKLPFEDNVYSAYTIAFGIRNVTRIEEALKEAYRVLKPGGRFMCLEFSLVENEILRWFYDRYSFQVMFCQLH